MLTEHRYGPPPCHSRLLSISLIQSGICKLGGSIVVDGGKVSISLSTRLDLVEEYFDSEEVRLCTSCTYSGSELYVSKGY